MNFLVTTRYNRGRVMIKEEHVVHLISNKKRGVRKGVIHKNVFLFYSKDKKNNKI